MNQPPVEPAEESLRNLEFAPTDRLLREDVKQLGALVGEILAEQVGPDFLTEVERVRRAAITRRESGAEIDELFATLAGASKQRAADLVRAFATYFQAINLAERVHRIRRRRDYERDGQSPQPGGLRAVLQGLRDDGVTLDEITELLPRLHIEPVFTAHPTEAVRRVLLEKEQEIVASLVADIDRDRTPAERSADRERMRMVLTAGWQTAEAEPVRPTMDDELEHVGFYLSGVLYRVLPAFFETFEAALAESHGWALTLPPLLRFGSWVGGDMDGNPNVGADTIAAALAAQRALVLAAYRSDLGRLSQVLSQSLSRVAVDPGILARIDDYAQRMPQAAARLKPGDADMPYRRLLPLMSARLQATALDRPGQYADAAEFLADVTLIERSLAAHRGEHAGGFALRRLRRRVEAFGFHLATLDLRQESSVHEVALSALRDPGNASDAAKAVAESTLAVFRTVAELRPRYGANAFGPYIISMSRTAADALAVLELARTAGCVDADDRVPLDVAPLFETVADLEVATDTLRSLFSDPAYRQHLAARGNKQIAMLGYSDSAKDGGIVASRWALQQAQIAMKALASESGIRITFFHGRGGSASRGGGKTERAVIAQPRGSVDGVLRLTEQGEVIHRKYGIRAIALRNLEQATGGVLRATLRPRPAEPREVLWRQIASELAHDARASYRALVHEHPQFPAYFRTATPIDVIERLWLGSRPSRRAAVGEVAPGIEKLRAIPWVFAWSQNRAGLTAWYGVGTALDAGVRTHGLETLSEMARDWPFFNTLVDDVEMVLAKSDMAIFRRYSRLAGDLHAVFHPGIRDEFERTCAVVLAIKGEPDLLARDHRLRLSIRLRNPYVDPISLLQVDLLERWRATGREDDDLFQALVATVNGIAAGIQNTG
ncbi:phosphoenolpyruvate carboxylase [soil metagenome]